MGGPRRGMRSDKSIQCGIGRIYRLLMLGWRPMVDMGGPHGREP
jgi:hypothetical protein